MSTLDHLRFNLAAALSLSAPPHDRTAAERWLAAAAAADPGAYCNALLTLIADPSQDEPGTRLMAAVQLKNVVAKRWREASSSSFSDADRARLRPLFLSWLLSEPQGNIARIAAVAVSKVARHEWPSSWPALLPELLASAAVATTTGDGGKPALRARLGLASVLKELSSKRLSSDVRAFRALAAGAGGSGENGSSSSSSEAGQQQQLLPVLWEVFLNETCALLGSLSPSAAPSSSSSVSQEAFDSWALALKCIRVLLVSGFSETAAESSSNNAAAGSSSGPRAVAAVAAALPPLTEACAALSSRRLGAKAALKVFKALRMISEAHPWSLVASGAVPAAVRVAAAAISSSSEDDAGGKEGEGGETDDDDGDGRATTRDRVVVQSCLLIKAALSAVQDATPPPRQQQGDGGGSGYNSASSSQRGGHGHGGNGDRLSSARSSVSAALPAARDALSGNSLASLADALVSKQLRLRRSGDLSLWEEDPECWALSAESGAAAWRDSRRGAAEALLSSAVAAEREALAPRHAQRLRETCARFDQALSEAASSRAAGASPSPVPPAVVSALVEAAALDKEAAAAAATVSSYELHDHVAFSEWLAGDLARDLEGAAGNSPSSAAAAAAGAAPPRSLAALPRPVAAALARRACLAIAAWVPRASREDRLRCYPPLISALAGGGESGSGSGGGENCGRICDAAVVLAAATALRALVDDWDFVEEDFAPLAGSAFAAAARALGGGGGAGAASLLSDADSHVQVFGLVGVIVDRLPPGSVAAHAPSLMQFLPAVWAGGGGGSSNSNSSNSASSSSSSILKVQCVSLLSRLLLSLGDESPAAYSALLPMLSECLSDASSSPKGAAAAVDLVEDGLGLWIVALRTAPTAWGGPRARPLVAAGCAAATQALERTSATALAPLAAAGAGSAALLSCVFSDESNSNSSSASAAAAAVEFATLPEAKLLCGRLALAAGEASERAAMALVASVDLILASITSSSSSSPEASRAALALLQGSLVRLTASVLRGKEGPAVAGGVAALLARVVLAGEESGGGGGGGGAALAALASAAVVAASSDVPIPPSLALIDLMIERAPSLPSGARKGIALALAAVLASPEALPTEALFASVAEANPAVAPWSKSTSSREEASRASAAPPPPSRPLFPLSLGAPRRRRRGVRPGRRKRSQPQRR